MPLLLVLVTGCAASSSPPPPSPSQPAAAPAPKESAASELPPVLRDLDLTPAQEAEILKIRADLQRDLEPLMRAAGDLGRSVAGAARQCKGDTPFVEADAARLVRMGEEVRGDVLDAVQRFHRLLTPAQRRKLSDRLLEADDWAKRERRNESRSRSLAPALDLSMMQTMAMLVKARVLWSTFADRAEPWRLHYETAIAHFARDDFDARHEAVAEVPIVALSTEFLRTGLRFLIPILEPQQCEALGRLIDEKLDEQAAKMAAQQGKGPAGNERR
ncbi:MAG: Spy/CpxP family protein refolding chaperone [Minicystis sp.]